MRHKIINIQSISDIITNSSSEVFVMNANNDAFKEIMNELSSKINAYVRIFETENDVKEFLTDNLLEYDEFEDLNEYLGFNPLGVIHNELYYYKNELVDCGIVIEDIVSVFLPAYKRLIGKAVLTFEDDCYYPEDINTLISFADKNDLIEHNSRH